MRKSLIAAIISVALASSAGAVPWHVMGPRAQGMGGAGVAIAQGPMASYWNPGGYGQLYNTSGFEFGLGARGQFLGSVLKGANDIFDINQACAAAGPECTNANIANALNELGQPGNGVLVDVGGAVGFKIKKLNLFVHNLTYVGATPQVDLVNNAVGNIANNTSNITLRGGNFTEAGVGFGMELFETGISVGGNAKMIFAQMGFVQQNVVTTDLNKGNFEDFNNNKKSSSQFGVDVGALWDLRETFTWMPFRPRIGLVGRNINNPKFDVPAVAVAAGENPEFALNGQFRAGAALSIFKWWHLAADWDLSNNLTHILGRKSRMVHLGTEINVFNRPWLNIPVRVGVQKDVEADSSVAYTAGFGLTFAYVRVDLAGMITSDTTQVRSINEAEDIPNTFGANVGISVVFGGKDEGVRNN